MRALKRFLKPLQDAAQTFFRHDLALRRDDGVVKIVLEQRVGRGGKRPPTRAEEAARVGKKELELMIGQLAAVLDEMPDTRQTMRHLVFVQHALEKKGLRALHKLPLDVLQRALEQFEGLVTNWSPVGLAGLRSKMAVAIIDREHMNPDAEADAYRTAAVMDIEPLHAGAAVEVLQRSDDEALAAAYAALGTVAPTAAATVVEVQTELGSPSARAAPRPRTHGAEALPEIELRELQT